MIKINKTYQFATKAYYNPDSYSKIILIKLKKYLVVNLFLKFY
jgi:hypothetical protein